MNTTKYSKKNLINLEAYCVELENIPVLTYEKLRFYEKYIVLALQNGVVAYNIDDLTTIISGAFNIKRSFVAEFIGLLYRLNYIKKQESEIETCFLLSDNFKIKYDTNEKKIMNILTGEDTKLFSNLLYFPQLNKFYNKKDILRHFKSTTGENLNDKNEIEKLNDDCNKNIFHIKSIIDDCFKREMPNLVLNSNFNKIELYNVEKYQLSAEILLHYCYNGEQSVLEGYDINEYLKTELSEFIQNKIDNEYKIDLNIPKFIEYNEFYKESDELDKQLVALNSKLDGNQKQIDSINKKLSKANKKNDKKDKKEIAGLESEKELLNQEQETIDQKQDIIIKEIQDIQNKTKNQFNQQIKDVNQKHMGKTVYDVCVRSICKNVDLSLSDININFFDYIAQYFRDTRDNVKTIILNIFNYLGKKKLPVLASYFDNKFNWLELDKILQKYKFNQSDITNLKEYIDVANAFCHGAENTEKRKKNDLIIDNFMNKSTQMKENILLAVIKLFDVLDFSESEKKEMMKL